MNLMFVYVYALETWFDFQMESEGHSSENSEHGASDGLDYILKQLDLMSEFLDKLEGKIVKSYFSA